MVQAKVRLRRPRVAGLVVWRGAESPDLMDSLATLLPEAYDPAKREMYLVPGFMWNFLCFWRRTRSPQQAAALAFLKSAKTRVVCTMENFDMGPLNQEGLRWSMVFRQHLPGLQLLKIQHGFELRRRPVSEVRFGSLAVWGQYSADWFPRFGRDESNYFVVGALKDSRYRALRTSIKIPSLEAICLISTVKSDEWWGPPTTVRRRGYDALVDYVARFVASEQMQLAVALTIDRTSNDGENQSDLERNYFFERFGAEIIFPDVSKRFGGLLSDEDESDVLGSQNERYSTYVLSDSCRLTIGAASSSLWEAFGRGNRVLAVNLTSEASLDFAIPGIWFLKEPTYEQFANRCRQILSMTDAEYDALSANAREYLMHYNPDDTPEEKIRSLLSKMLDESSTVARSS